MSFTSLPPELLDEIINRMSYGEIVNLCQTDKRFSLFCQENQPIIDNILYSELLQRSKNNLNQALVGASYYNNTNVFERLLNNGADPFNNPNFDQILNNIIKNRNYSMIQLLLSTIDEYSIIVHDREYYFTNYIITKSLNTFFPYLIKDYHQYITPNILLGAVKNGDVTVDNILNHLNKINFGKFNQNSFLLIIILYTLAYQHSSIPIIIDYLQHNRHVYDYINIDNLTPIFQSNRKLLFDLIKVYKIDISITPSQLMFLIPKYNYTSRGLVPNLDKQKITEQTLFNKIIDMVTTAIRNHLNSLMYSNPISIALTTAKASRLKF